MNQAPILLMILMNVCCAESSLLRLPPNNNVSDLEHLASWSFIPIVAHIDSITGRRGTDPKDMTKDPHNPQKALHLCIIIAR